MSGSPVTKTPESKKRAQLYFFSEEAGDVEHRCFKHIFKGRCGGGAMTCGLDSGCRPLQAGYHTCICRYDGLEVGDDYSCSKKRHGNDYAHGDHHEDCLNDNDNPKVMKKSSDEEKRLKLKEDRLRADLALKGSSTTQEDLTDLTTILVTKENTTEWLLETSTAPLSIEMISSTSTTVHQNASSQKIRSLRSSSDASHQPWSHPITPETQVLDDLFGRFTVAHGLTVATILASISVLIALSVFMAWRYKVRRKTKRKTRTMRALRLLHHQQVPQSPSVLESLLEPEVMVRNLMYDPEQGRIPSSASKSMFPFASHVRCLQENSIVISEQIGEGFFGKVYKGTYFPLLAAHESNNSNKDLPNKSTEGVPVAVKKVKRPMMEGYDNEDALANVDLLKEADAVAQLSHDNVLKLVGIVQPASGSSWMVMEYMEGGDLATWLRESRLAGSDARSDSLKTVNRSVTMNDLEDIARQIAAGLAYLAVKHFVHRDLACRNCLVGKDLVIKISDFGLARRVYSQGYYKAEKSKTLPVRWMSPESILFGEFTHASDIWAYGVVLWEIFALGKQPYYGYNGEEVIKMVTSGKLLEIPEGTPAKFSTIMGRCWEAKAENRIRAQEALSVISSDIKDLTNPSTNEAIEEYLTPCIQTN